MQCNQRPLHVHSKVTQTFCELEDALSFITKCSGFGGNRGVASSPETTLLLEILLLKYKLEREDKPTTQSKNVHIRLGVSNDNVFG